MNQILEGISEEQRRPVTHALGSPALVIAGAGSGKTSVLTRRAAYCIRNLGVSPRRIACITFTNKAAKEMLDRVSVLLGVPSSDPQAFPRISTIHSLSLSAIRKNPGGFGLTSKVTPLDSPDQRDLIKKLADAQKLENFNVYEFLEHVQFHRARGVGFVGDYTPEVHRQALQAYAGAHALSQSDLDLWKAYEDSKRKMSLVDFDDMLHLVVRRGREDDAWRTGLQRQFQTVLLDESQDSSPIQWQFIDLILHPDNLNLFAVGDPGQCQPPGTLVKVVVTPPVSSKPAVCELRPIETLKNGDKVVAWSKHVQITYSAGRAILVAQRDYNGQLVRIQTTVGSTECTPNHWNWVRFNKNTYGKYMVYLMYRGDLGFRVGISVFKRSEGGGKRGTYGLTVRINQEKADKGWILRVCDTRAEAEAWEEVYSVKYGIPESLFESTVCWNKTNELIRLIFSHANPDGARRCLADHGLLEAYPITQREPDGRYRHSWRGYFKTAAANILPGLMDIPVEGRNLSTPILEVTRRDYIGPVYSLDVDKDHTYIADGLVVGNSIFGFNGASPEILSGMVDGWRGVTPTLYKLEDNYRSLERVVTYANRIQSTMTGTVPLCMQFKRPSDPTPGKLSLLRGVHGRDIAESIAETIHHDNRLKTGPFRYKDNAILVRSASQVRDLETALVRMRIPYVVRGGQSLFQTQEARDLFAYLKLLVNPSDAMAFERAAGVPSRGIGPAAVQKLQAAANKSFQGDLVKAAAESGHMKLQPFGQAVQELAEMTNPVAVLQKIISLTKYRDYIQERNRKNADVVETKLGNLDKIKEAIQGLMEVDPAATMADVIFRVTMDQRAESEEEGVVVISTVHAGKGLEWPRVYVTNLYEGSIPHQWSKTDREIEEERRLFYVAVTRARDACVLCLPSTISYGPNTRNVSPSRFLVELRTV